MRVLILSDGETWETFDEVSDAMIVELTGDLPDDPDIDEIEQAVDAERYKIVDYIWDLV